MDAASAAIYGSRAPFGVILVTTKKGRQGKTTISYSNNLRWSRPTNIPDMMDAYTFAQYFNRGMDNSGTGAAHFFDDARPTRLCHKPATVSCSTSVPTTTKTGRATSLTRLPSDMSTT